MKVDPLIESFRDINKRFIDLVDTLSALSALSTLETEIDSEAALLKSALHLLAENLDLERCSIYILNGDNLECAAGHHWQEPPAKDAMIPQTAKRPSLAFKVGEGIVGLSVATGQLQISHDCLADQRVVRLADICKEQVVGSIMSVPIRSGTNIIGALNVSHQNTHHFSDSHERLLTLFGNFLGQIITNWRHIHIMQEQVQQRTAQLERALVEAHLLKERYEALSVVDALTELHNRRFFFPEAQAAFARSIRYGHPYTLMILDLDHFKAINDTYGHMAGDHVLKQVARILQSLIRECDILCRFGGEEFIIALPNTDSLGVEALSLRIHDALGNATWVSDGRIFPVTVTIGVAMWDSQRDSTAKDAPMADRLERLLKEADEALYFGKENGRSQTRIYGVK